MCIIGFMQIGIRGVKTKGAVQDFAAHVARRALDFLYPPQCLCCEAHIEDANALCADCWRQMRAITKPMCPRLGLPFSVDMGPEALSAEAIADPPTFSRARAAFVYNATARRLVSRLKYEDRPELARFCARAMHLAGAELLTPQSVLVPVPLHYRRYVHRRYNQSTELCRELGRLGGYEIAPRLVRRHRATPQQVGLDAQQRRRNVQGAFRVDAAEAARFVGRPIVIVDDVVTTGATVRALAGVLTRSAFTKIDVLSFARVVIGDDMPI